MNKNLSVNIAKDEYGKDLVVDLNSIRHLLVAGCTGSGKSVLLHKIIGTLISNNSPQELKLIFIDPKRVELNVYAHIPHNLTEIIHDSKKAVLAMKWATKEIDRRFDILKATGSKNIYEYDGSELMPNILIVVDEFSDVIQAYPKETELLVLKIAQMGHAVGVHIILSTSRPSPKIFTKAIRDVIGGRIAMQTASVADSNLVIGMPDSCTLRGAGDMLFRDGMKYVVRAQTSNVTDEEIRALCKSVQRKYKEDVKNQIPVDEYIEEPNDELYESAKEDVIKAGKASTSYIQRRLGIGYSRAAGLMQMLETNGVIGPKNGSKPREVIGK